MRIVELAARSGKTSTATLLGRNDFDSRPFACAYMPDYDVLNSGIANHVPALMYSMFRNGLNLEKGIHWVGPGLSSALHSGLFLFNSFGVGMRSDALPDLDEYNCCIALRHNPIDMTKDTQWSCIEQLYDGNGKVDKEKTFKQLKDIDVLILWSATKRSKDAKSLESSPDVAAPDSDSAAYSEPTNGFNSYFEYKGIKIPAAPKILISYRGLNYIATHGLPGRSFFRIAAGESAALPMMKLNFAPLPYSQTTISGELFVSSADDSKVSSKKTKVDLGISNDDFGGGDPVSVQEVGSAEKEEEDMMVDYKGVDPSCWLNSQLVTPKLSFKTGDTIATCQFFPTGYSCVLPLFMTDNGCLDSLMILTVMKHGLCDGVGSFERGTNPEWILLHSVNNKKKMIVFGAPRGAYDPSYDGTIWYSGLTAGRVFFTRTNAGVKADKAHSHDGMPYGYNIMVAETRRLNREALAFICDGETIFGKGVCEPLWRKKSKPIADLVENDVTDLFDFDLYEYNESRDSKAFNERSMKSFVEDPVFIAKIRDSFEVGTPQ